MHRVRNGRVVGDKACLAGLVVVGRDQQQGVGTVGLSLLGPPDGVLGIVGAGTRDHRHAPGNLFDRIADALGMLLVGQCRGLTGRAADDDGVGAMGNLVLNDAAQLVIVDAAVCVHRGDDGHGGSCKNGFLHTNFSLHQSCLAQQISQNSPWRPAVQPAAHRRRQHRAACYVTGRQICNRTGYPRAGGRC